MKVGQQVFLRPIGNASRRSTEIKTGTISKIGRKYFELEESHYGRFFIDSMIQDNGQYISDYICYLSMEDIENENEANELYREIKERFSFFSNSNLTLSQLRGISEIINQQP